MPFLLLASSLPPFFPPLAFLFLLPYLFILFGAPAEYTSDPGPGSPPDDRMFDLIN